MRRWRLTWLTVRFLLLRSLLGALRVGPKPDDKDFEIAVPRHQLAIVGRQVPRPRYNDTARVVLSVLARLLPRDRWGVFLVTPATLQRWHRELVRRRWTQRHTPQRRAWGARSRPCRLTREFVRR
jgi:putative transposase